MRALLARLWRSEWMWAPLIWAALSLIFWGEYLQPPPGQTLGGEDVPGQLAPMLRLALDELAAGRWPLWNPYLASGLPLWANPQLGLLYPPNWLLLVSPLNAGLGWIIAFHVAWVGLGMYVWARVNRLGRSGALVGAIALSYSGFYLVRAIDGHPNFIATLAWLPWTMAGLERAFQQRIWRSAIGIAVPLALSAYAGNPAGIFLIVALCGLAALGEVMWPRMDEARNWRNRLWPLGLWTLSALFAGGLAAAQWLPAAELVLRSVRGSGQGYAFASQYALPPAHLIGLLLPNFFGEPVRLGYWGEWRHTEMVIYPGLLTLLLTVAAVLFGRAERRVRLWLALAVVGLVLALGPAGGLHYLVYQVAPGFQLVRAPVRFVFWSLFALASLAAWAVDDFERHAEREFGSLKYILGFLGGALALAVVAFLIYSLGPREDARAYHIGAGLMQAGLFGGLAGAVLWQRPRLSRPVFIGAVLVILVADLWGYGLNERRFIASAADQEPTWPEAARLIPASTAPYPARTLTWGLTLFQQNTGYDSGIANALAYDPLIPATYQAFVDSVADPRARTFDLLGADYLLISPDNTWRDDTSLEYLGPAGNDAVYRRLNALPRAWVASRSRTVRSLAEALSIIHRSDFDPQAEALITGAACAAGEGATVVAGGTARIVDYTPTRVTVAAEGVGVLVLGEAMYPGWRVSRDGQPAEALTVDGVLRGVCLSGGPASLVFEFDPPLVKIGLALTALSLALTGAVAVPRRTTRVAPEPETRV